MAKPYEISITDGVGSSSILNGQYGVTSEITGYDNSTINPANVEVTDNKNEYAFTVSATGTLTIHVTEDGTSTGTAITGATFYRCDKNGTTYGNIITTNETGEAVFNNVPFDSTAAPTIYYKQISSDGNHEFSSDLKSTTMTTSTSTIELANAPAALRTITLTDTNYENLPIEQGKIKLS